MTQNLLKGVSQERIDASETAQTEFISMLNGKPFDKKKICNAFSEMSKDIAKERKRLGGDWVVAQAVPTRELRDHIKSELGPELVFCVLHMTKADQMARIKARHGNEESSVNKMLLKAYDFYEPAAKGEPNAIDVTITSEMSPDDVVETILEMIKKI